VSSTKSSCGKEGNAAQKSDSRCENIGSRGGLPAKESGGKKKLAATKFSIFLERVKPSFSMVVKWGEKSVVTSSTGIYCAWERPFSAGPSLPLKPASNRRKRPCATLSFKGREKTCRRRESPVGESVPGPLREAGHDAVREVAATEKKAPRAGGEGGFVEKLEKSFEGGGRREEFSGGEESLYELRGAVEIGNLITIGVGSCAPRELIEWNPDDRGSERKREAQHLNGRGALRG